MKGAKEFRLPQGQTLLSQGLPSNMPQRPALHQARRWQRRACPQRFQFALPPPAKKLRFAAKLNDACTQIHESPFRRFDAALGAEINQGRRIIGAE